MGDPSNFARIYDLYEKDWGRIRADISGAVVTDDEILATISACYKSNDYVLDPHGACGFKAISDGLRPEETGVFCETAHPAKFLSTVEKAIGSPVAIPDRLAAFLKGEKQTVPLSGSYSEFKRLLLQSAT